MNLFLQLLLIVYLVGVIGSVLFFRGDNDDLGWPQQLFIHFSWPIVAGVLIYKLHDKDEL